MKKTYPISNVSKIIILVFFIIIIYISYQMIQRTKKRTKPNVPQHVYIKGIQNHGEMFGIVKELFEQHHFKRSMRNWDIFLPFNYTNVETELRDLQAQANYTNKHIFAISGCDFLVCKNTFWSLLCNAYGREQASHITPQSWCYDNKKDMIDFWNQYIPQQQYILKKNVQRKEGLRLTSQRQIIQQSKKEQFKIIQQYISNVLCINGHKLNLRCYVLIICNQTQKSMYLHEYGKCIYTNKKYNPQTNDFEQNITSYNLNEDIYQQLPLTISELQERIGKTTWSMILNRLKKKLKQIKSVFLDVMGNEPICQQNYCFQLFGIDIIIDKDTYDPLILEFNKGPEMRSNMIKDYGLKRKVLEDVFSTIDLISSTSQNKFILL